MKIMIVSDIHGSAYYCRKMLECYEKENAKKMWILGDILYHGPRNDLPEEYAPKQVIEMLNPLKNEICAVRGNCDTEVDQMVLEFPVLADYAMLLTDDLRIYVTHGHIYNENHLPPLMSGDVLLHGHTHIYEAKKVKDVMILNPGSVSIPKGGHLPSYAVLEDHVFTVKDLEGNILLRTVLESNEKEEI